MAPRAYYNEHDAFAAAWLRELILDGQIMAGDVDERDIQDVHPSDVMGYTRCHWFAGIGGWDYALRLAGWPDDRPIWTGSCPCQPFSAAGARAGTADERHLWPAFFWLIGECRPGYVVGEQVASADALQWWDGVATDLESAAYACAAVDLPAASVGAFHKRSRLFWVADTASIRHDQGRAGVSSDEPGAVAEPERLCVAGVMADTRDDGRGRRGGPERVGAATGEWHPCRHEPDRCGPAGEWVDDAECPRLEGHGGHGADGHEPRRHSTRTPRPVTPASRPDGVVWLPCTDGKARPTESTTEWLADGLSDQLGYVRDPGGASWTLAPLVHGAPNRVGRLRGYGNAIHPHVAADVIRAARAIWEVA